MLFVSGDKPQAGSLGEGKGCNKGAERVSSHPGGWILWLLLNTSLDAGKYITRGTQPKPCPRFYVPPEQRDKISCCEGC